VPRVTERLLDTIVYIYRDEIEAMRGQAYGGTGCLVSYAYREDSTKAHLYAVTNSHVIKRDDRERVIRLNRMDGGTEVIRTSGRNWVHHDDADVAAISLDLDQSALRIADIPIDMFLTREAIATRLFTEGDDCLFIGRHYGIDGAERNTPAVRMGSVAIMQPEPVDRGRDYGRREESIAIEARSLSGFSGSPAFVWQSGAISAPVLQPRDDRDYSSLIDKWPAVVHGNIESRFAFLGITWGHMQGPNARIVDPDVAADGESSLMLNSGIMLAVPAWRIKELLDTEDFMTLREAAEVGPTDAEG
jgi:hypothetical protein